MKQALRSVVEFWNVDHSLTMVLALLIVLLFVVTPLLQVDGIGVVLNGVVFTLLAVTGTAAVIRRRSVVLTVALFGLGRLMLDWIAHGPLPRSVLAGDLILRAAFVLLIAVIVTAQVFRPGNFSHHRVQGAVAVYLLAALAWAYVYEVLYLLDPSALHISATIGSTPNLALFRFFSFETLTTLGYGDVLPTSSIARTLAALEALFGQLFPAVMIARLVSLDVAQRTARRRVRIPSAGGAHDQRLPDTRS